MKPLRARDYAGILALFIAGALIIGALVLVLIHYAHAGEYAPQNGNIIVPEWFWPSVLTGLIQGALVFGGLKVKLDWLFHRVETMEKLQREDAQKINARIDRALERRRATDTALD